MSSFANRLREARIAAGLTQEQLGFAVDVTKSSVSAWENGRDMPSFTILEQLPATLGQSLDYLICGNADSANEARSAYAADHLQARDKDEEALLIRFRKLSAKQRTSLLELLLTPRTSG